VRSLLTTLLPQARPARCPPIARWRPRSAGRATARPIGSNPPSRVPRPPSGDRAGVSSPPPSLASRTKDHALRVVDARRRAPSLDVIPRPLARPTASHAMTARPPAPSMPWHEVSPRPLARPSLHLCGLPRPLTHPTRRPAGPPRPSARRTLRSRDLPRRHALSPSRDAITPLDHARSLPQPHEIPRAATFFKNRHPRFVSSPS